MATSHGLTQADVEHVVLERGRVGETWRGRWDSFCLVTPNWTLQLPGHPYDGDDPDGFMPRRDLHYRTLRKAGVTLLGHFTGVDGRTARFAPDLGESVAWGDERNAELMDSVREYAAEQGVPPPDIPEPEPFDGSAPEELDLRGFGAAIFAGGFRPDYESWVNVPGAFDELGFPVHHEGASTAAPGLYFVGVHFLRKRKSALLLGVGEDAAIVARQVASRDPVPTP